jgi:hypothetical protein
MKKNNNNILDPIIFVSADPNSTTSSKETLPWWSLFLICAGWVGLWYFTPGLHGNGVGSLFTYIDETAIFIETLIALGIVIILVLLHQRYNKQLFQRSNHIYFYSLPLFLAIVLPFYYGLPLPVLLYILWMTVSVFWQDYLTFGLLQSYLSERLPTWAVILLVSVMFYIGHAIFIPDSFAPIHFLPALSILMLGIVMALLRAKIRTLQLILVLHLSFYFIFAF